MGTSSSAFGRSSKHARERDAALVAAGPFTTFVDVLDSAFATVSDEADVGRAEKRAALRRRLRATSRDARRFPRRADGAVLHSSRSRSRQERAALLSITVNPEACKGCNLCVAVCPDGALVTVKQDPEIVDTLRHNWKLWQMLPDTPDRFVNVRDIDEGIGVLPSLLLKKDSYRSMVGGDGACMGCGEKTSVHLDRLDDPRA